LSLRKRRKPRIGEVNEQERDRVCGERSGEKEVGKGGVRLVDHVRILQWGAT
jgi:hypothetical protein